MLKKSISELVQIEPIEYHRARKEYGGHKIFRVHSPRIIRYRELTFNPHLTQAILEKIIAGTKMKRKTSTCSISDRYLLYQYGNRPMIILDLLEKKICTTKGILEEYGERLCQQQASILMRLLKKHKQANFKRVTVTVNPYRIGTSVEDRKITYRAIEHLLRKSKNKEQ